MICGLDSLLAGRGCPGVFSLARTAGCHGPLDPHAPQLLELERTAEFAAGKGGWTDPSASQCLHVTLIFVFPLQSRTCEGF